MHRSRLSVAAFMLLTALNTSGCAAGPVPVSVRATPRAAHGELGERLARAVAPAQGPVSVAVVLASDDLDGAAVVLGCGRRFPMQSVFKLPLAMAVLEAVDRGELRLDQRVRVEPSDFVSDRQHSPIRDAHPGGVELTLGGAAARRRVGQ